MYISPEVFFQFLRRQKFSLAAKIPRLQETLLGLENGIDLSASKLRSFASDSSHLLREGKCNDGFPAILIEINTEDNRLALRDGVCHRIGRFHCPCDLGGQAVLPAGKPLP
ncbi:MULTISPECIES: hypothetical protein [Rhodopirellula]|uniref:hypothetical protein n=1 Tax=Rhodopirellula TaxID=265488 RepID=UPI00257B4041|nr:hypothetical protein [Rhodopirellula sp. UBA1907]